MQFGDDECIQRPDPKARQSSAEAGGLTFTSGTTGPAKAIQLPYETVAARMKCIAQAVVRDECDTVGLIVPTTTSTGYMGELARELAFFQSCSLLVYFRACFPGMRVMLLMLHALTKAFA